MEEDIDIGEDTLIYPKIEHVFSNVTNIKSEPIDYEESEYESIELSEYESNDYYISIPNKIILGSKPSQASLEPVPETSGASENWEEQESSFQCDECEFILPTQIELDAHKKSHSFLVARPMSKALSTQSTSSSSSQSFIEDSSSQEVKMKRQKAIKSTAKSALLNKTFPLSKPLKDSAKMYGNLISMAETAQKIGSTSDNTDRLLCNHCDERFPDVIALIRHTYELLPEKTFKCDICHQGFNTNVGLKGHRAVHFRKAPGDDIDSKENLLQCSYCTCFLKYPTGLKKHISIYHKAVYRGSRHTAFTGKCFFCSKTMQNYRQYNKHILNKHRKMFHSKTELQDKPAKGGVKYKCLLCNQIYATRYSAYKHKALKHPLFKKQTTFTTIGSKQDAITATNSRKPKLASETTSMSKNLSLIGAPIPKQTLFKCNKCQIHFVTCSTALEHSKRCALVKGDWKCSKCRRTFTHLERPIHTLQHEHSEKFKVHIVNDKILSKVICCCPKCELHFDENAFWSHVSAGCVVQKGVECNTCNLKIHPDSLMKHRKYHTRYGLSLVDYIVIEFVDAALRDASTSLLSNRAFNDEDGIKRNLYFCKICKTHSYSLKNKAFHLTAGCQNKSAKKKTKNCVVCGLLFSNKTIQKHVLDHQSYKMTLNDYTFVRIQDDKVINPALPEFQKCEKCKIRFISLFHKKNHNCKTHKWSKCSKCFYKYDSNVFDIHLRFHEYRSEPAETYECQQFYSCVICNYGFNSYDSLVEHCQNHYTDTEILKTNTCKICKLNYTDDHDMFHSNGDNFKILKFNYDKLLDDDWLAGFESVPKVEIEDVLSKSLYGIIRNIRLELLMDGPLERSLYKCVQCELCFDPKNIVDHTKTPCSRSVRYNCNSCNAAFPSKGSATKHSNIHVIFGDDISFREIGFNQQSDSELNEALRSGRKKESLKFRKCQYCDLLIKKNDFQNHIDEHEKNRIKVSKIKGKRKHFTILEPADNTKRMYTVYQCIYCKASIMQKANILRHNCGSAASTMRCNKCSLLLRTHFRRKHERVHLNLPKFVTKNITVLEFELHSENIVAKKSNRYSFDDDASTGSLVSEKFISKTYETRKTGDKFYVDNSTESEDSQNMSIANVKDEPNEDDSEIITDLTKLNVEMKNKLYQCARCYMCFVYKNLLVSHLSKCEPNFAEAPLTCDQCDITFHPSLTTFHEKLHHLATQRRIENYLYLVNVSLTGDHSSNKHWLFKCKICDVHFLSYKALQYHFSQNHQYVNEYVKCDICDLKFSQHSRTKHTKLQHDSNNESHKSFNFEIVEKIIIKTGEIGLLVKENSDNENKTDVTVDEITEDESQGTDVNKDKYNETYNKSDIDPNLIVYSENDASNSTSMATDVDENNGELSKDVNGKPNLKPYDLYKCVSCNVHYINKHTLTCHIRTNKRVHNTGSIRCNMCGLPFGTNTLRKHKSLHHTKGSNKRNFVINIITDVPAKDDDELVIEKTLDSDSVNTTENYNEKDSSNAASTSQVVKEFEHDSVTEKHEKLSTRQNCDVDYSDKGDITQNNIRYASSIDTDDLPLIRLETNLDVENEMKIIKLYQCKDCRVCVQKTQRKLHVCCSDIQKKHCIKCSLSFRRTDFSRHLVLHRKHLKLSRKNFVLVKFGRRRVKCNKIFKCVTCSTHFVSITALEWHLNAWNHQTKRVYCEICCLFFGKFSLSRHIYMHHTKMNLTSNQFDIVSVSTADMKPLNSENIDSNTLINTPNMVSGDASIPNSKSMKKLFKCFECDVYFLTQTSYYRHMYKHTELDPTEYIACKMCDMQFLTDDLGVHMKSHRDKTFSLENLLIEGYQPNENESPRVESYLAVDSLNSKLVSTTTPFDNEEETVSRDEEQLSTVDSTSTKLQ